MRGSSISPLYLSLSQILAFNSISQLPLTFNPILALGKKWKDHACSPKASNSLALNELVSDIIALLLVSDSPISCFHSCAYFNLILYLPIFSSWSKQHFLYCFWKGFSLLFFNFFLSVSLSVSQDADVDLVELLCVLALCLACLLWKFVEKCWTFCFYFLFEVIGKMKWNEL